MPPLSLCACWFPPAAVAAVAGHGARPTSRAVHVHPSCRRGPSPAPVRIQDRTHDAFRSNYHRHYMREPEPESDDDEPVVASLVQIFALGFADLDIRNTANLERILDFVHGCPSELRKFQEASIDIPFVDNEDAEDEEVCKKHGEFCASMGLREAPDMFPIERGEISNYMIRIASSRANDQDVNNKVMSLIVCAEAQKALDLASRVMDLMNMASLDLGTPEFSQDTVNKMVRTYAPTFLNVAKDAYSKSIEIDSVLSFLEALRGLGAICHILVQDTVAMLKDAPLENRINSNTGTHSLKFEKRLNNLKEEFWASAEATGIKHTLVMGMLFDGMKRAQLYIVKLIQARREALDYLFLAQAASVYKERRKNC